MLLLANHLPVTLPLFLVLLHCDHCYSRDAYIRHSAFFFQVLRWHGFREEDSYSLQLSHVPGVLYVFHRLWILSILNDLRKLSEFLYSIKEDEDEKEVKKMMSSTHLVFFSSGFQGNTTGFD